jgi:PAS domain S-box-containing protein
LIAVGEILGGSYDSAVVLISILISMLGAYAALDLAERSHAARGLSLPWIIGAAAASAVSTWSMHYVGMLAFHLPVAVLYHWPTALLSFVPAFLGAALALTLVTRPKASPGTAWMGGVLLGAGIAILHYVGMASMRSSAMHHYSPAVAALSVLLPMILAGPALQLTFFSRGGNRAASKAAGAVLLGAANPVMHYTAMAGTTFMLSGVPVDFSRAVDVSPLGTSGINIVTTMVLAVALVTSLVDRLREQRALLDELFEQAPQAVALMDANDRVVRVNREFTRLFGYAPAEVIGRRLDELIVPEEVRAVREVPARETEGERLRKDGTRLQVAMLRVPVVVPGGQVSVYGIYQDISERKRAQELLQSFSKKLIETQEGERRRVARELHDEIGQVLTAIRLNLNAVQHSVSAPIARKLDESIAIVDRALQQVRNLSLDLRPLMLDDLGLVAALRWYVDREAQRAGLTAEFIAGELQKRLSPELETACFRIAQEALTNVARHAKATHVRVELSQRGEELHLVIRDDGIGFDAGTMGGAVSASRLGLTGMRERALIVGGRIEFVSAPGQGTEIHARFPLGQPRPPQPHREHAA